MQKFIFTFGAKHPFGDFIQPIFAEDSTSARRKMFELFNDKWAFQYSEEEWEEIPLELRKYQELEAILVRY